MKFDDALEYFSDGTIDLVHIDGCHHYDAAKHDFYSWLPKLSSRGVVLFHDSFMRSHEFGVWRLIEELGSSYGVFEFTHGHGLAVVAVGPDVAETPLGHLFQEEDKATLAVRRCFATMGKRLVHPYQLRSVSSSTGELSAQAAEKDALLQQRHSELRQKDIELRQKDVELANKDTGLANKEAELQRILGSYSWRITEPLRRIARHLRDLKSRR